MGVDVESCTVDAGYSCASNLDMFYDGNHSCVIDFVSRVNSNDLELKQMIDAERDSLQDSANLVGYDGRWVFIKKKRIFVGRNKDNPAWLYLGLDLGRNGEEMKNLSEKEAKKKLTDDEVYELTRRGDLFALVSGREYACGEILPRYGERQAAEQLFDFLKNYAKITPLGAWTEETVRGHQLLSFIACTAVTLLHLMLKPKDLDTWESLQALECLLCTRCRGRIVVDPREKEEAEVFRAAGIKCPHALPVAGGRLCYAPPAAVDRPLENGAAPEGGRAVRHWPESRREEEEGSPSRLEKQEDAGEGGPRSGGRRPPAGAKAGAPERVEEQGNAGARGAGPRRG